MLRIRQDIRHVVCVVRKAKEKIITHSLRLEKRSYKPVDKLEMTKIIETMDMTVAPPETEPERQYYFIRKLQLWMEERKAQLGRPLTACVTTFGCQMNARDSEKILGILQMIGYEETDQEEADLVLYNTCTVRENANLKVYGHLGQLKRYKKQNPEMLTMLCGCMMQEKTVVDKIKTSYRNVDIIFGTHNIFKFA